MEAIWLGDFERDPTYEEVVPLQASVIRSIEVHRAIQPGSVYKRESRKTTQVAHGSESGQRELAHYTTP